MTCPTVRVSGGSAAGRGSVERGYDMRATALNVSSVLVPYDVAHAESLAWEEREPMHGQAARAQASITDATNLKDSRARMWRYPAHTRGRRHKDPDQEEVFVPIEGTLTMLLGEPPERVDVDPGGVVVVHIGTPMQARNETGKEILFLAYGAPTEHGNA